MKSKRQLRDEANVQVENARAQLRSAIGAGDLDAQYSARHTIKWNYESASVRVVPELEYLQNQIDMDKIRAEVFALRRAKAEAKLVETIPRLARVAKERLTELMDKFQEALVNAPNPSLLVESLSYSERYFQLAAEWEVYNRAAFFLEEQAKIAESMSPALEKLQAEAVREVSRRARNKETSSSVTANLMDRCRLTTWAEMLEMLETKGALL